MAKKKFIQRKNFRRLLPVKSWTAMGISLILVFGLAALLSAQIGIFFDQPTEIGGKTAPAPITSGNPLSSGNSSKEYIYAGGRLLATEEPTDSLPHINLAYLRPATQSTDFTDGNGTTFSAARAVDGNTDGDFNGVGSTSATKYQFQPAWQVDLGSIKNIDSIQLWSRTDCCPEMLRL